MNLATLAEESAERQGERRTLVFHGRDFTNVQILEEGRRLQRAFGERGLEKGKIAALCMINDPVIYPVFQGIFRSGAAAVPVMSQFAAPELRYVLQDTRAHAVITDLANLDKVRTAVSGLENIQWIAIREGTSDTARTPQEWALEELVAEEPERQLPAIDEQDLAILLYTSGTTGKPKGAMLTHANLVAAAKAAHAATEYDLIETPRVTVSAMPMAHIFGVGVMNSGYLLPSRLRDSYMAQLPWFEPESFMRLIQEHRANTIPAVPTMLALVLHHPRVDEYDLSTLEDVICGAAPLPVELGKAFADRFQCRVREIYGMTESTGLGTANRRSATPREGSAGQPYPGIEMRIVDADDQPVPTGELGEIVQRGPTVMVGYLNRPEATAETLRGGWLHTGDIGYLDEDGYLYVVDRKKDMILRGGENIYPAQIEDILYQHPRVAEAAVVGAPDPVYGEQIVAYVVLRPGPELDERELIAFAAEHTSRFKAPSKVFFVRALPKSSVGKILRRELRDQAKEALAAQAS